MSHFCHLRFPIEFWRCEGGPCNRGHLSTRSIDDFIDAIVIWEGLDETRRPSKFQGTNTHRPEEVHASVRRLQQLAGCGRLFGGDVNGGGDWRRG